MERIAKKDNEIKFETTKNFFLKREHKKEQNMRDISTKKSHETFNTHKKREREDQLLTPFLKTSLPF